MSADNVRKLILTNCHHIPDYEDEITGKVLDVFNLCYRFAQEICKGRDESHSINHLLAVTENSLLIIEELLKTNNTQQITVGILEDVVTCAILHDIADYKYDRDNVLSKQVKGYINDLCKYHKTTDTSSDDLWWIIDNLSFSKERKAGSVKNLVKNTYTNFPFPNKLILIRNIVADADRLEAIGEIGAKRCIVYGQHTYPTADKPTLKEKVKEHAEEKLYMMPFGDPNTKEPYFHTGPGKAMALERHKDTVKYINQFLES
jgi:HD superfamily phosphodiesterase